MPPIVALIGCTIFVLWLLRIEHKQNPEASLALWIPTIWMLIAWSRPLARWFEVGFAAGGGDQTGSPLDRLVLSTLILLALLILFRRKIKWSNILKDNNWLMVLYLYLGISILWSDLALLSLKRWIRLLGVIPIAMVVISERTPLEALESVLRRCAYVLIPFSIVVIKYFPHFGRVYNRWDGQLMWVGVSGQKNGLGMICALSVFILIWGAYRKWKSGGLLNSKSQTLADAIIVGIALLLIRGPGGAYSATSIAVLVIAIFLMTLLFRNENFASWMAVHMKGVLVALPILYLLFSATLLPTVLSILGRDESLTGRTDIWRLTIDIASSNPILGVGYGAFWGLPSEISSKFGVKQAHNGYLGVYLETGIAGIIFLFAFFLEFCSKIRRQLNNSFEWGLFGICFLLMVLLWNYSEDTFLKTSLLWSTMIFVAVVFSSLRLQIKKD
jgi:O-antigen ligase